MKTPTPLTLPDPMAAAHHAALYVPQNATDSQLRARAKTISEALSLASSIAKLEEDYAKGSTDPDTVRDAHARASADALNLAVTGRHDYDGRMWSGDGKGFKTGREYFSHMRSILLGSNPFTEDFTAYFGATEEERDRIASENEKLFDKVKRAGGDALSAVRDAGRVRALDDVEAASAPEDVRAANDILKKRDNAFRAANAGRDPLGMAMGSSAPEGSLELLADGEIRGAEEEISKYRDSLRRAQIRSKYEAKLFRKNAAQILSRLIPSLSPEARDCAKAVIESEDNALPASHWTKFNMLSEDERRLVVQARNIMKPAVESGFWNTLGDMALGAANVGLNVATGVYRQGAKIGNILSNTAFDAGIDVNEISRRRQLLFEATGNFFAGGDLESASLPQLQFERICEDHGFLADAFIGAASTLPYMFAAGLPKAGTALVALDAMQEFDNHVAINGGDIANPGYIASSAIFGGIYAYIEKLQLEGLLGGVTDQALREASLKGMWSAMKSGVAPRMLFSGTLSESVQEGLQNGIASVHEALALGGDAVRAFGEGFTEDFVNSLGTMFVVEAGGLVAGHVRRSGGIGNWNDAAARRSARSADLAGLYGRLQALDSMVELSARSAEWQANKAQADLSAAWKLWQSGGKAALASRGALSEEAATELDDYFTEFRASQGAITAGEEAARAARADDGASRESLDGLVSRWSNGEFDRATFMDELAAHGFTEKGANDYLAMLDANARMERLSIDAFLEEMRNRAQGEEANAANRAAVRSAMENLSWAREIWSKGAGVVAKGTDADGKPVTVDPGAAALAAAGFAEEDAKKISNLFQRERAAAHSPVALDGVRAMYDAKTAGRLGVKAALAHDFGGRLVRLETGTDAQGNATYGDFLSFRRQGRPDALVRLVESDLPAVDFTDTSDEIASSVEEATRNAPEPVTAQTWREASDAQRRDWVDRYHLRKEGYFRLFPEGDPSAAVDAGGAGQILGEIVVGNNAALPGDTIDTSSVFHEIFHAWSRFMAQSGIWTENDIEELRKRFGDPKTGEELFNEEAAADAFRAYVARRMSGAMQEADEKDGILRKLFNLAHRIKGKADEAEARSRVATEAGDALFDQILADSLEYKGAGEIAPAQPVMSPAAQERPGTEPTPASFAVNPHLREEVEAALMRNPDGFYVKSGGSPVRFADTFPVLSFLGVQMNGIFTNTERVRKMVSKHFLTTDQIVALPGLAKEPAAVFVNVDDKGSIAILTDGQAPYEKGNPDAKPVMIWLEPSKDGKGGFVASAYSRSPGNEAAYVSWRKKIAYFDENKFASLNLEEETDSLLRPQAAGESVKNASDYSQWRSTPDIIANPPARSQAPAQSHPEAPSGLPGTRPGKERKWSAATPTGNIRVSGHWQAIPLKDLIHSNNPLYARYMRNQLRNRQSNKAEEDARENIVRNFDPARLFDAPDTANGAPIVFLDVDDKGETRPFVLSGNGRVMVLNALAERHIFDKYRNEMRKQAAERGIDPGEGDTVLVRVVDDYGGATREKVADLSNTNSIQQYTEEEQARADAEMVRNLDLAKLYVANADGTPNMSPGANDEFFSRFIQATGDTALYNADRTVTDAARARMMRALLAVAVGNGPRGRETVKALVDNADTLGIVRQKNALAMMAAPVAALEGNPDYAIGADVSRAVADFIDFMQNRDTGRKWGAIENYLGQEDMLDPRSAVANGILELLGSKLSASDIAAYVQAYCDAAAESEPDGGLFGDAMKRTRTDIWRDAKKLVDRKLAGGKTRNSLSANPRLREEVSNAFKTDKDGHYIKPGGSGVRFAQELPVMTFLGVRMNGIFTTAGRVRKMKAKHFLTEEQIVSVPQISEEPVAVFLDIDGSGSHVILTAETAPYEKDNPEKKPVMILLRPEKGGDGGFIASVYSRSPEKERAYHSWIGKLAYLDKNKIAGLNLEEETDSLLEPQASGDNVKNAGDYSQWRSTPDIIANLSARGQAPAQSHPGQGGSSSRPGMDRHSISGVYTGSAADYDKPSLHYIGTGEGAQVYGWGLYGSTVRGVAEGYAQADRDRKRGRRTTLKSDVLLDGKPIRDNDDALENHLGVIATLEDYSSIDAVLKNYEFFENHGKLRASERADYEWLKANRDRISLRKVDDVPQHIYEQTFFTNRAPGDESHLLKWYGNASDPRNNFAEQEKWIRAQAKKEGVKLPRDLGGWGEDVYKTLADVLGSPQAASEFLARAGIDGIKYPVNSYGKTVKDGDKAGWNYVSFRDDNIRVDHKWTDGVQRYSISSFRAWPEDFPNVMVHTTRAAIMSNHAEDFRKAKAGDREAAARIVEAVVKQDKLRALAARHPDAIVVPVQAEEETGRNKLPRIYALAIARIGNLKYDESIVQTVRAHHTGADAFARLSRRAEFEGTVEPGREYILADDHVTQGGTLSELRHYIENNGGNVVEITTLTASKGSAIISPRKATLDALKEKFEDAARKAISPDARGDRGSPQGREGNDRLVRQEVRPGASSLARLLAAANIAGSLEALTESEAQYLLKFSPEKLVAKLLEAARSQAPASVAYDDAGNAIPLSQRFDLANPDIRYSVTSLSQLGKQTQAATMALARGENATIRNEYGDIAYEIGKPGRITKNGKIKGGYGLMHIVYARMAKDGATLEEALDIAMLVGDAIELGHESLVQGNKHYYRKGDIEALFAINPDTRKPVLTGYKIGAVESDGAIPTSSDLPTPPPPRKEDVVSALAHRIAYLTASRQGEQSSGTAYMPGTPSPRHSVSGVYTGSAADYDKPSLHYVGTGEGAQVYGWGLYASTVRGVAENYARLGNYAHELARLALQQKGNDKEAAVKWIRTVCRGMPEVKEAIRLIERGEKLSTGNIYEQTFFTDRAPGDESHLLKWYEAVTKENMERIRAQLLKDGVENAWLADDAENDFRGYKAEEVYANLARTLGSAQAASEFLARAGIDGIKYPVDSYGGKGVKDGDKAGWNYVSFRDDNIRVDHKWTDGVQRYSVTTRVYNPDVQVQIVDGRNEPAFLNLTTAELRHYLRDKYMGREVSIDSDGTLVEFTSKGLQSALKKRDKHKRTLHVLDALVKNAHYTRFEENDGQEKHSHLNGQFVYTAALRLGDGVYGVELKLDLPKYAPDKTHFKGQTVKTKIADAALSVSRANIDVELTSAGDASASATVRLGDIVTTPRIVPYPSASRQGVADHEALARNAVSAFVADAAKSKRDAESALVNFAAYFRLANGPRPTPKTIGRLGLAMGMSTVNPAQIDRKADALAESMRGTIVEKAVENGDAATAVALMKRSQDADRTVDAIISGSAAAGARLVHTGVGQINSILDRRVEQMMRTFDVATLADMEGETGLDLAAEILANDPHAFDPKPASSNEQAGESPAGNQDDIPDAPGEEAGGSAGNQDDIPDAPGEEAGGSAGSGEEGLSDYERFRREETRKAAEAKVAHFIEQAKLRAAAKREEAERRRRQQAAAAPAEDADDVDGDDLPGGSGSRHEQAGESPAGSVKADFKSKEEFAAFLRVWAADRFRREHGMSTLGKAEHDRLFAEFYRLTARKELSDLADKLLPPAGARAHVNRRLQSLEKGVRPDTIERISADVFAFINAAAIRESRKELVAAFRKRIRDTYAKGRFYEELKLDTDRRVTGWVEEAARYICKVCELSLKSINGNPSQFESERAELMLVISRREKVYEDSGRETASAAKEDMETRRAYAKLALLEKYGAMTSLMPGEILDLQQEAEQYLKDKAAELEELWRKTRVEENAVKSTLAAAIRGPNGQRYEEKGWLNGRLFDALNGLLRLRLKHLTRFASDSARASASDAINRIIVMLGDGETAYAKALQEDRARFFLALGRIFSRPDGSADNAAIKKYLERLNDKIPQALAARISHQGFADTMTYGQMLQLLVSLEQRSYREAVLANGREDQASLIRTFETKDPKTGASRRVLSQEDIRFIDSLRNFYSEKRKVLSPVMVRMVGQEVDSPDPLYMPVKMSMDDRARGLHVDTSVSWDPVSSVMSRRVATLRDFDESASIVGMFFNRSNESAKLLAWAERGSFIRAVFTSIGVQSAIRNAFGSSELSKILKQLEATFNGGEARTNTPGELAPMDKALNFTTYAYLGFNPLSALRQTTSFTVWANALPGGFKDLWRHMTHFDKAALDHLKQSDEYKIRYGSDVGASQDLATRGLYSNPSQNPFMRFMSGAGMKLLKWGDFIPGGWIAQGVYKDILDRHLKEGMSFEEADRLSITETFNLLEETQQSGRTYNTNMLTIEHGRIGRLLTQFATSPLQQLQYETQAWREWRDMVRYGMDESRIDEARGRFLRAALINHVLLPAALNLVTAMYRYAMGEEPPWGRDGWHWTLLIELLMGQFSRVFFLGAFATTTLNALFKRESPRAGAMLPVEGILGMAASSAFVLRDLATLDCDHLQKDFVRLLKSTAPTRIPYSIYRRLAQ